MLHKIVEKNKCLFLSLGYQNVELKTYVISSIICCYLLSLMLYSKKLVYDTIYVYNGSELILIN